MKNPPSRPVKAPAGNDRSKPRVGLINESRPGLGERSPSQGGPPFDPAAAPEGLETEGAPRATPRGYVEPRPEPREQPSDSFAHEQERSTGVSGHLGNS